MHWWSLARTLLVIPFASACIAPGSTVKKHFDGGTWLGALVEQTGRTEKLLPALLLLGATAGTAIHDRGIQKESVEAPITEGSTTKGDGVAIGLGVLASSLAFGELAGGDEGRSLEVLLESAVVVDGVTEILKHTIRRKRPGSGNQDSFPSGHTSFAFAAATLLARGIDDLGDEWYWSAGYLAFIPAAYVGIDRSEADRHWPSDVAFGAFLGFVLTNIVYDAHYGTPRHPGIYDPPRRQWSLEPSIDDEGSKLELVFRF